MSKSYAQIADSYFRILAANPNTTATKIYERYKGSEMGMRKTDSLELTKAIKQQLTDRDTFLARIKNSDMTAKTQKKLSKLSSQTGYKYAKNSTRRGKALTPKGVIYDSVQGMNNKTFNKYKGNASDFVEFY